MKQRGKRRLFFLGAATSGLFVAAAWSYLSRDRVPQWVVEYSRPSRAWVPGAEYWGHVPAVPK